MTRYVVNFLCDYMVVTTNVDIDGGSMSHLINDSDMDWEIMQKANDNIYVEYGFYPYDMCYDYNLQDLGVMYG